MITSPIPRSNNDMSVEKKESDTPKTNRAIDNSLGISTVLGSSKKTHKRTAKEKKITKILGDPS